MDEIDEPSCSNGIAEGSAQRARGIREETLRLVLFGPKCIGSFGDCGDLFPPPGEPCVFPISSPDPEETSISKEK